MYLVYIRIEYVAGGPILAISDLAKKNVYIPASVKRTNLPVQGLSLSRSQRKDCSTRYSTPTES
jgi:hypothetical protein